MAVSLFNGCSDFLDKQPLGKLNESVLTDEITVNKLLIACYSPLNGFINGVWGITGSYTHLVFPLGIYLAASFIIYKAKLIETMKELLQRYIKGEVSEKERLKIASWLDESPENMR